MEKKAKVAVGISGGVDSTVSAALLREQGYEVIGVHLYCWDKGPYCTADKDRASAVRVAKHLDIPLLIWDLRKEYKKRVIGYFFDEYRKGRTPNPDVMCNREIKFGIFMERALKELKVDKIATGHYARVVNGKSLMVNGSFGERKVSDSARQKTINHTPYTKRYALLRGVDEKKDQSYFLWILRQEQLERLMFPIGHMLKKEVRAKAKKLELPCAERPDSQGICFIGPVNVAKFLREHLPIEKGPVVRQRRTGYEVIGEHDGVWFYTEGQRRGFSARSGQAGGQSSYPLYVIKKDIKANTLVVGRGKESEVSEFEVEGVNWISLADSPPASLTPGVKSAETPGVSPAGVKEAASPAGVPQPVGFGSFNPTGFPAAGEELAVGVRIRHLGEITPATLESVDSKSLVISQESLVVTLTAPTRGVAPGQSAVLYKGDEVLGGGVISSFEPALTV